LDTELESLVGQVVEEFQERARRGEQPDVEDYARRHPPIAEVLRQLLPAVRLLQRPARDAAPARPPAGLEGYPVLREVGRGGGGARPAGGAPPPPPPADRRGAAAAAAGGAPAAAAGQGRRAGAAAGRPGGLPGPARDRPRRDGRRLRGPPPPPQPGGRAQDGP